MERVKKLEDWTLWQKTKKIAKDLEGAADGENFKKEELLRKQLMDSGEAMINYIAEGVHNKELIPSLSSAKKASQEARSSVYEALEKDCLSKEDFDYFYNELAHLSSSIGKIIIDLKFKR